MASLTDYCQRYLLEIIFKSSHSIFKEWSSQYKKDVDMTLSSKIYLSLVYLAILCMPTITPKPIYFVNMKEIVQQGLKYPTNIFVKFERSLPKGGTEFHRKLLDRLISLLENDMVLTLSIIFNGFGDSIDTLGRLVPHLARAHRLIIHIRFMKLNYFDEFHDDPVGTWRGKRAHKRKYNQVDYNRMVAPHLQFLNSLKNIDTLYIGDLEISQELDILQSVYDNHSHSLQSIHLLLRGHCWQYLTDQKSIKSNKTIKRLSIGNHIPSIRTVFSNLTHLVWQLPDNLPNSDTLFLVDPYCKIHTLSIYNDTNIAHNYKFLFEMITSNKTIKRLYIDSLLSSKKDNINLDYFLRTNTTIREFTTKDKMIQKNLKSGIFTTILKDENNHITYKR
ncbi:hypothetical protein PPL_01410 [Heterostelium album PN500]|uniref:Uncharacterized protein n=1 Tax=Heterostelium pallidum (strain ATCC 26659 / Pp 5 / PN500) TaxID=670386 RepID=D3AZ70_HETP5|nr:hypothetical protein PPL_01410 [Heterostelium album PN500]EFA85453.1 hypothetical protein PPL_01410 [Heterostelium album PN500]|eukprot:XP_020437562.1 hypothetical protein PPL_01410 [Heterostelium album PN500]